MRKVLLIDCDPATQEAASSVPGPVEVTAVPGPEALSAYETASPDAVVADIGGDRSGIGMIERIREKDVDALVVAVSQAHDMETMVEVIRKGAFDCLTKPVNADELIRTLEKVFMSVDLHRRLKDLPYDAYRDYKVDTIVGKSRAMEEIFKTIGMASEGKVTVLIQGESGTGKELIARAIHYSSPEKDRPFMAINCSALVETLLESELFGYEKGSFTGALGRKEGRFELARGGTVFLDEIGEMSQALQVKLLRVLQERSFERVGGSEPIRTDVRVIAATNKDLKALTESGAFREDLYYRLKVITIDVPPLRERSDDIPLLVSHLLEKANRELHKKVRKVPEGIMELLMSYPWPGNIRELENVITRGVLLARGDVLLDVYLPGVTLKAGANGAQGFSGTLEEVERAHIARALERTGWNKSRAALLLGVTLPRLARKIRKYGLKGF